MPLLQRQELPAACSRITFHVRSVPPFVQARFHSTRFSRSLGHRYQVTPPCPSPPLSNGLPGWPDERRQGQDGQKTKLDWILFLPTVDMTSVRTLPEAQRPGRPLRLELTHPPARLTMQPLGLSCFSSSLPPTLKHEIDPRCANLTRLLAVHDRCRRCGDGGGVS